MSDQYVYFIQADENGPIKIGFTADDPKRRLSQLQTGNPSVLKLLGAIKGSSAREKQFHADLADWRLQGEWFEAHPAVVSAVQAALTEAPNQEVCGGPYCSFCGICKHATGVLVAAMRDDTYICSSCIGACAKLAAEHLLNAVVAIPATKAERCDA